MAASTVGRVLDLDPELGSGIGAGEWEKARRACRGYVVGVRRGVWQLPPEVGEQVGRIGLVIVEGMVVRGGILTRPHRSEPPVLLPHDVNQRRLERHFR